MFTRQLIRLCVIGVLLGACACSPLVDYHRAGDRFAELVLETLPFSGDAALALAEDRFLSVGADGLRLHRPGAPLTLSDAATEFLDVRRHGPDWRAVTLTEANRLLLAVAEGGRIDLHRSEPMPFAVEGLCLFETQGQLQVLLLGDDQLARQAVLLPRAQALETLLLRTFPLPPGAEYCAVDDATEQLFVNEEAIGVWAYSARAESELRRRVVDLVEPYGRLRAAPGALAVAAGTLLVATGDGGELHHFDILAQGARRRAVSRIQGAAEIETLAVTVTGSAEHAAALAQAVVYDEASGQLARARLQLPSRTAAVRPIVALAADGETEPVADFGDAADDPAIWRNRDNPAASRVLGTNKQRGLNVYDLSGALVQSLAVGRLNNVDVRPAMPLEGVARDIAAASHRDHNSIALFAIDRRGQVTPATEIATTLDEVYGLCLYRGDGERLYVFINDQDGRYQQIEIVDSPGGWQGHLRRQFRLASQPEGCSADEQARVLFVGEEGAGVWRLPAEPDAPAALELVIEAGELLVPDIEGMEVFTYRGERLLLVSSQGDDSYAVFTAEPPFAPRARFRVGLNAARGIDGASETDGLTVHTGDFGGDFRDGLVVVQDGRNLLPAEPQNFKYIGWGKIAELLKSLPGD